MFCQGKESFIYPRGRRVRRRRLPLHSRRLNRRFRQQPSTCCCCCCLLLLLLPAWTMTLSSCMALSGIIWNWAQVFVVIILVRLSDCCRRRIKTLSPRFPGDHYSCSNYFHAAIHLSLSLSLSLSIAHVTVARLSWRFVCLVAICSAVLNDSARGSRKFISLLG
jgi:hypothetical protein